MSSASSADARDPASPPPVRALALDLGQRRIGLAVSNAGVATPYETLARARDRSDDHRRVGGIVEDTGAGVVVVGLPLSLDGSLGPAARAVLDEVAELRGRLAVPVVTWDERLSTVEAERSLRAMGLKGPARRRVVDRVAATVILQSWLDAGRPHG